MLSSYQVTREITSALPESLWPEVNRRVRADKDVFSVCRTPGLLAELLKRPGANQLDSWRPVSVGLTALEFTEPEVATGDGRRWLTESADGRERLNDARAFLFANDEKAPGIDGDKPIVSAVSAAVALEIELTQNVDSRDRIIQSATHNPVIWRLPLSCLYGLLDGDNRLCSGLLESGRTDLADIVVHIWQSNETKNGIQTLVSDISAALPTRAQLCMSKALRGGGSAELAVVVGQNLGDRCEAESIDGAELSSMAQVVAGATEGSLLALETGQDGARDDLSNALQVSQSLAAGLALRLGETALVEGDAVSALAAFEQAERFGLDDFEAYVGTARAKIMLRQSSDALEVLSRAQDKSARRQLVLAQAQVSAGDLELATETASGCIASLDKVSELEECADILSAGGKHEAAATALEKAISISQWPEELMRWRSSELLQSGRIQDAREAGFQAMALKIDGAEHHAVLARALEAHDVVMAPEYRGALEHWSKCVELIPERNEYKIGLARCSLNAGDPEMARTVCVRLLDEHRIDGKASNLERASSGEAHALLAQARLALGEHAAAGDHFQKATQLAPQFSEPWRAIASFHGSRGEIDRARSALETGLKNVGQDDKSGKAVLLSEIAGLQLQMEEHNAAVDSLRDAAALQPTDGDIQFQLGEVLLSQGDYVGAATVLKSASENLPANASVWHALGRAQQGAGDASAALEALQRAQASGMQSKELAMQAGTIALELSKFDLARSNLETVAEDEGADASTLCAYASTLEQAEEWNRALEVYKRAIPLEPENNSLVVGLGKCCLKLDQTEAAIAALAPAAEGSPGDLELQQLAALAYTQAGMWDAALPIYDRIVRLAPDDVKALSQAAGAASNSGDRQRAIELLHRAAALKPDNAHIHSGLARVYADEKRWEEARDSAKIAIELDGNDGEIYRQLGEYCRELGDMESAILAFKRATEIQPENVGLLEALAEAQFRAEEYSAAHKMFLRAVDALHVETIDAEKEGADVCVRRSSNLARAGDALVSQNLGAQAIALWQKALLDDPTDGLLQKKVGGALLQQGRFQEASTAYETAIREDMADVDVVLGAAEAAMALGEQNRARHRVQHLIQQSIESGEAAYRLGVICQQLDDSENALFAFRQAVALSPELGVYRAMMARALADTGNLVMASDEADRAMAAAHSDMDVLGHAGVVLLECDRRVEATNILSRVISSNETSGGTQLSVAQALVRSGEMRQLYDSGNKQPHLERKMTAEALERAGQLGMDSENSKQWVARAQILIGDLQTAISTLEAIGARVPTADVYCALASAYFLKGDNGKAQQAARWVLDRDPENLLALLQLSRIAGAQRDSDSEMRGLERAVAIAPDDAITHYLLGQAFLIREDYDAARTSIARAIQLSPERVSWYAKLAEIFRETGDSEAAISQLEKVVRLSEEQRMPAEVRARYLVHLAREYVAAGDDMAAREQYEAALSIDSSQSEWVLEAANACMDQGDSAAAMEKFGQAAAIDPQGIGPVVGGLKAAMASGDYKQAEKYALSALKQDPDNSMALTALSELYRQRGDTESALVSLDSAIENAHDLGPVLLAKARVLTDGDRLAEALAVLDEGMAHLKENDEAWALVGAIKSQNKDWDASIAAYKHASELAPLNLEYELSLGRLCRKVKQLDQALVHLNNAMKAQNSDSDAGAIQEEFGKLFVQRRQFDRAYEAFANAIAYAPTKPVLYFQAGLALKNLKDYGEAITMFRKAVQMDPKNLDAHRQLAAVSALGRISGEASR